MRSRQFQTFVLGFFVLGLALPGGLAAPSGQATHHVFAITSRFTGEPPTHVRGSLALEERLACQTAIEDVYWQRRIWPSENPGPKPALDSVMPVKLIQEKVEDSLRMSNALEQFWGQPITRAQLQAEMDRMARDSKEPQLLQELWAALGNDPQMIAECLARPLLVNRLIQEWYAHDERFHGALEAAARADLDRAAAGEGLAKLSGAYSEFAWVRRADEAQPTPGTPMELTSEEWEVRLEDLAASFNVRAEELTAGQLSDLREDASRFFALAILEKNADRVRVASVEWRKQSFEDWWETTKLQFPLELEAPAHDYHLSKIAADCADDTWQPTKAIPDPRYQHTAVWTGSEMIVWGGMNIFGEFLEDNGLYDPATDTWRPVSRVNTLPSAPSTPPCGPEQR